MRRLVEFFGSAKDAIFAFATIILLITVMAAKPTQEPAYNANYPDITTIKYHGCEYIQFNSYRDRTGLQTIIHSPQCKNYAQHAYVVTVK